MRKRAGIDAQQSSSPLDYDLRLTLCLVELRNDKRQPGASALKAAVKLGLFSVICGTQCVPKEDRISPPPGTSFSLVRLGTTPEGDA